MEQLVRQFFVAKGISSQLMNRGDHSPNLHPFKLLCPVNRQRWAFPVYCTYNPCSATGYIIFKRITVCCDPSHMLLTRIAVCCDPSHMFLTRFTVCCDPSHIFLTRVTVCCDLSHMFLTRVTVYCDP